MHQINVEFPNNTKNATMFTENKILDVYTMADFKRKPVTSNSDGGQKPGFK